MKKIICVFLAVCLLVGVCPMAFAEEAYSDYPVIIVPGYGASPLFLENDDGSPGEQVWGWNIMTDLLLDQVKQKFPGLFTGAVMLTVGSARLLGQTLGQAMLDMLGKLAFNGDGESVNRITTIPNDPARCRLDVFEDYFDEDLYSEKEIGRAIDDYVPRSQIFNFAVDFRYGPVYNAEKLNEFIGAVKEYTGKEKVNLYAVSHGGQVTAAYLLKYGENKDVANAVLTVPAVGGSYVAYDVLTEQISAQEEDLIVFIENAMYLEQDFEWLLKSQPLEFVDDVLLAAMPYLRQVAGYWESLWDFLPYDCYAEAFDYVDADECAGLIAKTTDFHENVMVNFGEALRRCRDLGINVNIVAGDSHPTVTGSQVNSDAIIGTASATGAKVAPFGQRFSDGYVCAGDICADETHNHLSPSMEIDASYCYLPENTWFVEGMYHGMTMNEAYAEALVMKLLLTDDLKDVYTDPAFPQFRASENRAWAVYGRFNNTESGYLNGDSVAYTVTNLSDEYGMKILSIAADGLDITFEGDYSGMLAPGESAEFAVKGDIPKIGAARAAVTVTYRLKNSYTPLGYRTFRYTVDNGAPAAYDAESPYAPLDFNPPAAELIPANVANLLKKLGVWDFINMLLRILKQFANTIKNRF
ncbi:MAG: hypothetical protein IK108_09180 [Clostridia bacterium]|nr:hypothetical protein [Clostridia bacterium]